jgi:hypothetical protein
MDKVLTRPRDLEFVDDEGAWDVVCVEAGDD